MADCLRSFSSVLHGLSSTNWTSGSQCQSLDHYFLFSLHLLTGFASTFNSSVKILHASFPCCWHRHSVQDSCYTFGIGKLSSHKILGLFLHSFLSPAAHRITAASNFPIPVEPLFCSISGRQLTNATAVSRICPRILLILLCTTHIIFCCRFRSKLYSLNQKRSSSSKLLPLLGSLPLFFEVIYHFSGSPRPLVGPCFVSQTLVLHQHFLLHFAGQLLPQLVKDLLTDSSPLHHFRVIVLCTPICNPRLPLHLWSSAFASLDCCLRFSLPHHFVIHKPVHRIPLLQLILHTCEQSQC